MIPDGYPYKVGYSWAPPYRFQRVTAGAAASSGGKQTGCGDMQRLQTDVLSLPALQLIDLLRAAVAQEKANPAAELLLRWNCEVERDSAAAALYEVWLQIVTRETMDMAIPPAARTMIDDWSPHQVHRLSRGRRSSGNGQSAVTRDLCSENPWKRPGRKWKSSRDRIRRSGRGGKCITSAFVIRSIKCRARLRLPIHRPCPAPEMSTQ